MNGATAAITGLPTEVRFCRKCVMSNQRPASSIEHKRGKNHQHRGLAISEDGVCDACRFSAEKKEIDWKEREDQLLRLLDKYRSKDGSYDCISPGSGGKDSVYAAHLLKYKYGMHPLTVTRPPILYTDIGLRNFRNWLYKGGFDNISFNYNAKVHALLTRLAIENILHPFQPFILGQKNLAPKLAAKFKIPLVFYGENEAEYGNPIADNQRSLRDKSFFSFQNREEIRLSGLSIKEIMERYHLGWHDLQAYLPPTVEELEATRIEVHYLGYYVQWVPQETYYYSVEHTGFEANPFRTEGTYSKYNSLDDKIDGFHYYTTYIKFGLGRATYDSSQEIRNRHITREEAVALVRRFDGEFPKKYFLEIMDYIGMKPDDFHAVCDRFRPSHLWEKQGGKWRLKHTVWQQDV